MGGADKDLDARFAVQDGVWSWRAGSLDQITNRFIVVAICSNLQSYAVGPQARTSLMRIQEVEQHLHLSSFMRC